MSEPGKQLLFRERSTGPRIHVRAGRSKRRPRLNGAAKTMHRHLPVKHDTAIMGGQMPDRRRSRPDLVPADAGLFQSVGGKVASKEAVGPRQREPKVGEFVPQREGLRWIPQLKRRPPRVRDDHERAPEATQL